jgi:NitT/TauT family transport system substrate-binding protein
MLILAVLAAGLATLQPTATMAADRITIALASGGRAWDFSVADFGKRMGFFAEEGIDIEVAATDNLSDSLQAIAGGNVEVANVGVTQFFAAAMSGAPIKLISSAFTGSSDWLWYVRADSPIRSLRDLTGTNTVAVTSLGSSQYIILDALLTQYGVKPQVISAGSMAAAMAQVMSGQVDVGTDGNGLLGVPQYADGKVRTIAYGRELDLLRNVSVRALAVRADALAANRDLYVRFLRAYQHTIDWMYQDPKALEWFAENTGATVAEATRVRNSLYPAGHMNVGDVLGIDVSIEQGLLYKRLTREPTKEELAAFLDVPWKPAAP